MPQSFFLTDAEKAWILTMWVRSNGICGKKHIARTIGRTPRTVSRYIRLSADPAYHFKGDPRPKPPKKRRKRKPKPPPKTHYTKNPLYWPPQTFLENGKPFRFKKGHFQAPTVAKLTEDQVREIKWWRAWGAGRNLLGRWYGVHKETIKAIDRGWTWKHAVLTDTEQSTAARPTGSCDSSASGLPAPASK